MIASLLAAAVALQAAPTAAAPPAVSPADPLPVDWRAIPDDEIVVMTLAGGRTVTIRLAAAYAPEHVANIRRLAAAHYWDGTTVYRVQDNWVTQWGGQPDDPPNDAANKPLPAGVVKAPAAEYDLPAGIGAAQAIGADAYARATGVTANGWAIASGVVEGPTTADAPGWLAHCYGTVGVARDASPDTGSGSELFMPIGGTARRLDRNYTIVGRVIEGARFLSGLPRSDGAMGMFPAGEGRVAIVSVRLASELPAAERPHYQYRAADNPRFAAMIATRRQAKGMVPTGGPGVCEVPLATRRAPAG